MKYKIKEVAIIVLKLISNIYLFTIKWLYLIIYFWDNIGAMLLSSMLSFQQKEVKKNNMDYSNSDDLILWVNNIKLNQY